MDRYTLRPCRDVDNGNVEACEACEACEADFFTIYRRNEDGTEDAVIHFEFEDSVEMVCQWANATRELQRLVSTTDEA